MIQLLALRLIADKKKLQKYSAKTIPLTSRATSGLVFGTPPKHTNQTPPQKVLGCLALSSFSTQHAQCCVPASSVVTQWVCYPENHVNAFFWIKETHLATLRPTGDPKQNRSGECIFSAYKSSSATSASEQLLELLLLKELSEAAAFSARLWHGVKPRFWARGTSPLYRGPMPPCQAAENTPAAENCLSSSSSISSSSSCSEALVSCRKRFVKRKKCIRPCGSVLSPG